MSDSNENTETGATYPRVQTTEAGVTPSDINTPEEHTLRTQYVAPLVQQSLDNTSITIEEIASNRREALENSNETNNTRNIMEQYARFLRDQVAGLTRSRLSAIIAVTRNNETSEQNTPELLVTQSDNSNYGHSLTTSHGSLNGVLRPRGLQPISITEHFVRSTQPSHEDVITNPIMLISGEQDTPALRNTISNRAHAARIPLLASEQHPYLSSYFRNNIITSETSSGPTSSNLLNQPISNSDRLIAAGRNLTNQSRAATSDANASTDNSIRPTEESATSTNELYNNVYPDIVVATLRQCLHYIPFACILFVKFIYDHLLGILDIILLQFVMYCVNKSLQAQVIRLDQKKNALLMRDLFLVSAVVTLRLLLASAPPDLFGLLIGPSPDELNIVHQMVLNLPQNTNTPPQDQLLGPAQTTVEKTVVIPKLISIEAIIYYIAINDLVLKLITIAIKLLVTLLPLRAIRHKSRTRLYVFIEVFSQFYRSLVPIRQWLLFLFESYSGLHAISGVMFSSTYIVLKGCELADRGKSLKLSFINLLKDVDKSRRPPGDNFDAIDEVCAICQDTFVSPVVLECGHIFCDNCVTTWFKREQTCPMCRAKVGDNLAWHDGSTTFFYQLY